MNIECRHCGIKIDAKRSTRRFCSQKCADAQRYVSSTRVIKTKNCGFCGKNVHLYPREEKINRMKFCNMDHYVKYLKSNAFRKNCIVCGKVFFCQPIQEKIRNRQTCSIKCRSKNQSLMAEKNRINNGFTKNQIDRCIRYSAEADRWRKAVFERDNFTCNMCGKRGGYLEADHIKPFAFFPNIRFELSNGRTLCKECHNKTKIPAGTMRMIYSKYKIFTLN